MSICTKSSIYRHYLCLQARKRRRKIIKDLKKKIYFFCWLNCAHIVVEVVERYFPIFFFFFSFCSISIYNSRFHSTWHYKKLTYTYSHSNIVFYLLFINFVDFAKRFHHEFHIIVHNTR